MFVHFGFSFSFAFLNVVHMLCGVGRGMLDMEDVVFGFWGDMALNYCHFGWCVDVMTMSLIVYMQFVYCLKCMIVCCFFLYIWEFFFWFLGSY